MENFKRILAGIVIAVSILGIILCLSGIIGVWVINTPLTESFTGALADVEIVLDFSLDRLTRANTEMAGVQDILSNLEEKVTEAGENLTENSPTLTFLSNTVGTELKPKIEMTAEVIGTLRETIVSVNSTLENANSIPFVSVPTLPMEQLTAIDQQMQEMVTAVKTLGDTVKDVESGIVDRTTTVIMIPVDKLSKLIAQVQTPVEIFNSTLSQVKTGVVNANARIPNLIDWGSILITLILTWFTLAQASLLYGGWYYWKIGTIPAVQIQSSQNSQEAQNETHSSDSN